MSWIGSASSQMSSAALEQEIIEAAREFVATTTVFRQAKASRDAFTRLAVALIEWRKENDPDA